MSAELPEVLLSRLSDASFFYSASDEYSDEQQVGREHEASHQVIAELGRMSRELAEVPHDETGLNLERINGFFGQYRLIGKSFVGVDEAGQQDINNIVGYGRGDTLTVANHFPLLDFTYVLRGDYEAARGPAAIEAEVVHELFHAYHGQPHWDILMKPSSVSDKIFYRLRQTGFVSQTAEGRRGDYPEEAGAETMLHKYVAKELKLPNGFLDRTEPQEVREQIENDVFVEYLLPGSYLYTTPPDGRLKWHKSAHAAFGMQLLIAQDPAIFSAMLASRRGVAGLREFAGRINALNPGLYSVLNQHSYDHTSFAEGTRHIIDTLYDGDQEKALAVALEHDSEELIAA